MASKLAEVKAAVTKKYGSEVLAGDPTDTPLDVIPTGSILLDLALSVGGIPRGRLVEIFGPPSSGKSTLTLCIAKETQKLGLPVLYLDYEHAFTADYARRAGVSLGEEDFVLSQPNHLEEGLNIMESFIEGEVVGLIVVDSLAAAVPQAYLEGDIGGDKRMAEQARVLSQGLKRLVAKIAKSNTAVIWVNHIQHTMNTGRGSRTTTPGGEALKFYSSVRIELRVVESVTGRIEDPTTGKPMKGSVASKVLATCVKNKVGFPFRDGWLYVRPGAGGIDDRQAVLDVATGRGIISQAGAWFRMPYQDTKGKQLSLNGAPAFLQWCEDNPERYGELRQTVVDRLRDSASVESLAVDEEVEESAEEAADVVTGGETEAVCTLKRHPHKGPHQYVAPL